MTTVTFGSTSSSTVAGGYAGSASLFLGSLTTPGDLASTTTTTLSINLSQLLDYPSGSGLYPSKIWPVIYSDNAGSPLNLVGYGNSVTVSSSTSGVLNLPITATISASATYWFGVGWDQGEIVPYSATPAATAYFGSGTSAPPPPSSFTGSPITNAAPAVSVTVANNIPTNTAVPTITGTKKVGSTLTSSTGTWTNTPTSYGYQWVRGTTNISGATASTYTLVDADDGQKISVIVTATNSYGSGTAQSAQTAKITYPVPTNTAAPVITGNVTVGATVTCSTGSWTNSPTSYSYSWVRHTDTGGGGSTETSISGATASTYTVQSGDTGYKLACYVTATNDGGSSSQSETATTAIVTDFTPHNTAVPTISGAATVGSILTASTGTWAASPNEADSFAYQWKRSGSAISGATSSSYTLVTADDADTITVTVTGTNSYGSTAATSAATATVTFPAPVNTALPTITGTASLGNSLTASQGTWTGSGIGYTYQWKLNGSPISGATASTFYVGDPSLSGSLTVSVTGANDGGSATATSSAITLSAPAPGTYNLAATVYATTDSGWTGSNNLGATDGVFDTYNNSGLKSATSGTLTANIPFAGLAANAAITGITLVIQRKASATNKINDSTLTVTLNGATSTETLATTAKWPSTVSAATYGNSTDTMGIVSPIVGADGSVAVSVALTVSAAASSTASVDSVALTLNYSVTVTALGVTGTGAAAISPPTASGSGTFTTEGLTSNPTITGTIQVGQTITALSGAYLGNATSFNWEFDLSPDTDIANDSVGLLPSPSGTWTENTFVIPATIQNWSGDTISTAGLYIGVWETVHFADGSSDYRYSTAYGPITAALVTGDASASISTLTALGAGSHGVIGSASGHLTVTASSAGAHGVVGSGSAHPIISATGSGGFITPVTGTGSATVGQPTAQGTGVHAVQGSGSGHLTISASGAGTFTPGLVTGSGAASLTVHASGVGTHGVQGSAAAVLSLSAAGAGVHIQPITGTASATLTAPVANGSGTHGVTGAATASLTVSAASVGTHGAVGQGSAAITSLTASGAAVAGTAAYGAATIAPPVAQAIGTHGVQGSGAAIITSLTASGSGQHITPATGSGHASLTIIAEGFGSHGVTGLGGAIVGSPMAFASGTHGVQGSGSASVGQPTATGSGNVIPFIGRGAASISITAQGQGSHGVVGEGSASISITASGQGSEGVTGAGAAIIPFPVAQGQGGHGVSGSGLAVLGQITAQGHGAFNIVARVSAELSGSPEIRALAGEPEMRSLAGDGEVRAQSGAAENRALQGSAEVRRLAG